MSYDTFEQSQHDGAPIECYRFLGSFRNYYYTSSEEEVLVGVDTYFPLPLKRNAVKAGTQSEDGLALEIELPFDTDIVNDYAYAESPPRLTLEIIRVHRGSDYSTDWKLAWKGRVTAFSVTGRVCKLKVPSIFAQALQGDMPSAYYQNPCNHVLFDSGCKLARGLFSSITTVTTADKLAFDVADDGAPDHALAAGEAVNQRTGERRMILDNIANAISITYPFVDNQVGDQIELTYGCDHAWETCKTKFNNGDNYGGHPFVPQDNPFEGSLS